MFSRENSKLQMIETAHVNKRKQASMNQYPVGDDVSTLHPLRSSATPVPSETELAGGRDDMEQPHPPRREQDLVPPRTTGGTARRVGRNDAPALFWGITQGRVDGLQTILLGAPNRVTELQPWL